MRDRKFQTGSILLLYHWHFITFPYRLILMIPWSSHQFESLCVCSHTGQFAWAHLMSLLQPPVSTHGKSKIRLSNLITASLLSVRARPTKLIVHRGHTATRPPQFSGGNNPPVGVLTNGVGCVAGEPGHHAAGQHTRELPSVVNCGWYLLAHD